MEFSHLQMNINGIINDPVSHANTKKRARIQRITFQISKPISGHGNTYHKLNGQIPTWCLTTALKSIAFHSCQMSQNHLTRKERSKKRTIRKRSIFFKVLCKQSKIEAGSYNRNNRQLQFGRICQLLKGKKPFVPK